MRKRGRGQEQEERRQRKAPRGEDGGRRRTQPPPQRRRQEEHSVPEPRAPPPPPEQRGEQRRGEAPADVRAQGEAETPAGGKKAFEYKVKTKSDAREERETCPRRLEQRQKQIDRGKNTLGYQQYLQKVPRKERKSRKEHPRTPDIEKKASKRAFDGLIKAWRRQLHEWDPEIQPDQQVIHEPEEPPVAPPDRAAQGPATGRVATVSKNCSGSPAPEKPAQDAAPAELAATIATGVETAPVSAKSTLEELEDDDLL